MHFRKILFTVLSVGLISGPAVAQESPPRSQITMGNGAANAIQVEGLTRQDEKWVYYGTRINMDPEKMDREARADASTLRANTTGITFPEVTIEKPGWLVLHPVIDGRPDGDIVSGFAYLEAGVNDDVTIHIGHPAQTGDKFLVMLHSDVNQDRVFDFVFVEDGINVEDRAVFEGTRMIAHMIALPE